MLSRTMKGKEIEKGKDKARDPKDTLMDLFTKVLGR